MRDARTQRPGEQPPEPDPGQIYRHKRRGGIYTVLGRASLQTNQPIEDDQELVIYRAQDGRLWARPVGEFYDGRFEHIHDRKTKWR
jgi:hypothetical protein